MKNRMNIGIIVGFVCLFMLSGCAVKDAPAIVNTRVKVEGYKNVTGVLQKPVKVDDNYARDKLTDILEWYASTLPGKEQWQELSEDEKVCYMTNGDYTNAEDYLRQLKQIYTQAENESIKWQMMEELLLKLEERSTLLSYNEIDYDYYAEEYERSMEDLLQESGYSLDEWMLIHDYDKEGYLRYKEKCIQKNLLNYYVIDAVARQENLFPSQEQITELYQEKLEYAHGLYVKGMMTEEEYNKAKSQVDKTMEYDINQRLTRQAVGLFLYEQLTNEE